MNFIKDCLKGICIGAGAILPGISSGVLCVIFGIYDKLVKSIFDIFHHFKKNFLYLLPIALGTFIGIFLFGNLLHLLFENFPMQTNYAFIGLILGSIPLLIKKINRIKGFRLHYLLYTIIAFIVGLFTVLIENSNILSENPFIFDSISTNISLFSPSFLLLLIGGFFMSIGIVVPGISSTLILMCFGIYDIYLEAISTLNFSILIPLGCGVLVGGVLFLKIVKYLLDYYYIQTFYSIIGFTLGSVLVLYTPISFNFIGLTSVFFLILGFYISNIFESKS